MTAGIKDELCMVNLERRCCRAAELSALIRTEGVLHLQGNEHLALHTESENAAVARTIIRLSKDVFHRTPDLSVQRMPRLRNHACFCLSFYENDNLLQMLDELELLDGHGRPTEGLPKRLLRKRCCKYAYLRGAFLGCGFLGDMRKNKHLEFNLASQVLASELTEMLKGLGMKAGLVQRRTSWVVYLKSKESILQLIAAMGAHASVLRIENELIYAEIREEINRLVNCETANLKKITKAAQEQIKSIRRIDEEVGLEKLPPSLQDIALLRLRHPDLSLTELGKCADPPLSKGAVQHRFERIARTCERLCGGSS